MSPRTSNQFREIREEKKTLIMDVALLHFANEGYFKTTITHIARHAGISKGLMYNYFESKEALLEAIIRRSVLDVYGYFDIDKDGFLTEDEFDFFVRRISHMLQENKSFWRLLFQLLMQNDVREMFLKSFLDSGSVSNLANDGKEKILIPDILKTITNYFVRKKEKKGHGYDPYLELNMFLISLKGFALTYTYTDSDNDNYYEKTVNRIIELYK